VQLDIARVLQVEIRFAQVNICISQGAPERIIDLCTKIRVGDNVFDLDNEWKKVFNDTYEELGGMGERVIGNEN